MPSFKTAARTELDYWSAGEFATPPTDAIQQAIDEAMDACRPKVHLQNPFYYINDTIHLGYGVANAHTGDGLMTVQLHGQGSYTAATSPTFSNTTIISLFVDRPFINIQGGRNSGVGNIMLATNSIGAPIQYTSLLAHKADTDYYIPTGASVTGNTPYCGISIDAYSGGAPADPYPTPDYPDWITPPGSPYGRAYSSQTFIKDCVIGSCWVGILQQPNADQNGDFTKIINTQFSLLRCCYYIGNSQARSCDYTNVAADGFHTFVATRSVLQDFGNTGNIGGNAQNLHFSNYYQIFDISAGWTLPMVVTNLYSETGMRIGTVGDFEINFNGCTFSCHAHRDNQGSPPVIIEEWNESVMQGNAHFVNCYIRERLIINWFNGVCSFDNCGFNIQGARAAFDDTLSEALQTAAWGLLAGVVMYPEDLAGGGKLHVSNTFRFRDCGMVTDLRSDHTYRHYSEIDDAEINTIWSKGMHFPNHGRNIMYDYPRLECHGPAPASGAVYGAQGTEDGRTLTVTTVNSAYQVGDVLFQENPPRNWFYVESIASVGGGNYELTCKALTGYKMDNRVPSYWLNNTAYTAGDKALDPADSSSWECIVNHTSAAAGTFAADRAGAASGKWIDSSADPFLAPAYTMFDTTLGGPMTYFPIGTRFTPTQNLYFKITASSTTLEFVNAAGSAVSRPSEVVVNSKPLWHSNAFAADTKQPLPNGCFITAVAGTSATLSAAALVSGTYYYGPGIAKVQ